MAPITHWLLESLFGLFGLRALTKLCCPVTCLALGMPTIVAGRGEKTNTKPRYILGINLTSQH